MISYLRSSIGSHEEELENFVHKLQENGQASEDAEAQAHSKMLPVYRKRIKKDSVRNTGTLVLKKNLFFYFGE